MNYKTQIAYDFDGVLCDTMPAFHQFWREKYNHEIRDFTSSTFEMNLQDGYDLKDIYKDITDAINTYQPYLQPYAFALELVREFARQYNEQPIIITARRAESREVTSSWLKAYLGIPFTLMIVGEAGTASGANKPEILAGLGVKYFVEDRFKTCNSIKSCERVFMPDRSWNWNRTPLDHVVRVNNLLDVWDYIEGGEGEDG
jgi:uncharacterized HAD superfamily protein